MNMRIWTLLLFMAAGWTASVACGDESAQQTAADVPAETKTKTAAIEQADPVLKKISDAKAARAQAAGLMKEAEKAAALAAKADASASHLERDVMRIRAQKASEAAIELKRKAEDTERAARAMRADSKAAAAAAKAAETELANLPMPAEGSATPAGLLPGGLLDKIQKILDLVEMISEFSDRLDEIADRLDEIQNTTNTTPKDVKPPVGTTTAGKANRIYLLLLVNDARSNNLATGMANSINNVDTLFAEAFPSNSGVQLITIPARRLTANNALEAINAVPALGKDDVLFCYVCAHGGPNNHPNDPFKQFFETSLGEQITRANLWYMMEGKGAGLTVLMADSCFPSTPGIAPPAPFTPQAAAQPNPQVLRHLLLDFTGEFNLNSSSQGENSWYTDEGIFTRTFVDLASQSNPISWDQFLSSLQTETNNAFAALVRDVGPQGRAVFQGQSRQVPFRFASRPIVSR